MTTLNTIIEEEKERNRKEAPCWDSQCDNRGTTTSGVVAPDGNVEPMQCEFCTRRDDSLTTAMQRAYEAGKASNALENTPDTEWEEGLQNIMEGYIMTAELGHLAKDELKHKQELRAYWKDLKDYITNLLTSRNTYWKERVRKAVEEVFDGMAVASSAEFRAGYNEGKHDFKEQMLATITNEDNSN